MPPAPANESSSLLNTQQDPISVNTIEYDFENYALEYGIPETLDPLPYRKAGSVFATGEEAEPVLTSAKHDPRLRTVVCRHWLRDLCMKGSACEFLHQYDLSKMPLCRHGERCKIHDCPFRHISEANRLECVFYSQGFCIHGPFCRYKHVRRDRIDLPAVADFTLGLSQMQAAKDGPSSQPQTRRPAPKPNEFYKISLCKHFLQGECPFGEGCHFAHGEHELRNFPRPDQNATNNDSEVELSDNMFQNDTTTTSTMDYFQGGAAGGGKPSPILEPDQAHFFILLASAQADLAISTVRQEWYIQKKHAEQMNKVFVKPGKGKKQENGQVLLFFTVSGSRHIQGAALLTSEAVYDPNAASAQNQGGGARNRRKRKGMEDGEDDSSFSYRIGIEWYRTTEFPVETALEAAPDLLLPTKNTQFCQDMSSRTGESLMKATWNSPLVTLYEAWTDEYDKDEDKEREPPAPDALLTDFRCPPPGLVPWPVMPGPGFIFGCSSDTMDECLGRGIFGLPAHMKAAAKWMTPGSTVFLFNVTDRLLFGIFEALTPAGMNYEATAFSKNPKATSSPFPVQIRVRVALECPPLEDNDPLLNDILRSRGSGRIGALTFAQTEAIASLLASQCGALNYMLEYQEKQDRGIKNLQSPPIALPPKKIASKK